MDEKAILTRVSHLCNLLRFTSRRSKISIAMSATDRSALNSGIGSATTVTVFVSGLSLDPIMLTGELLRSSGGKVDVKVTVRVSVYVVVVDSAIVWPSWAPVLIDTCDVCVPHEVQVRVDGETDPGPVLVTIPSIDEWIVSQITKLVSEYIGMFASSPMGVL